MMWVVKKKGVLIDEPTKLVRRFSGWTAEWTDSMQVQFYYGPIKWTKPDLGPFDGLTSCTGQPIMVFKTL